MTVWGSIDLIERCFFLHYHMLVCFINSKHMNLLILQILELSCTAVVVTYTNKQMHQVQQLKKMVTVIHQQLHQQQQLQLPQQLLQLYKLNLIGGLIYNPLRMRRVSGMVYVNPYILSVTFHCHWKAHIMQFMEIINLF